MSNFNPRPSRRAFLRMCLAAPLPMVLAACSTPSAMNPPTLAPTSPATPLPTQAATTLPAALPAATTAQPAATSVPTRAAVAVLAPTPACDDGDPETIAQTEGPYFTPNSPERSSLRDAGLTGTPMLLRGFVASTDCSVIAGALVDLWHANDQGEYDNVGYTLRGHQFTDAQGRFAFETIVPGLYPGRTRHFHIKVQPPNRPVLTTQLYFPDEPDNARDGIFNPLLLMSIDTSGSEVIGEYTFVVQA